MARVEIFTTPFCIWCKKTKEWFKEHKVKYEEHDVSVDDKAREKMKSILGQAEKAMRELQTS